MNKLETVITNHFENIINKCNLNNFQKCLELIHKIMNKTDKIKSYNILTSIDIINSCSCNLCVSLSFIDVNEKLYIKNIIKKI